MNKMLILIALAVNTALCCWSGESTNDLFKVGEKTFSRAELQAKIQHQQNKKHGGYIVQPNSARGRFVVMSAQDKVPLDLISQIDPMINRWLRFRTTYVNVENVSANNIMNMIKQHGGSLGVAVVSAGNAPMLFVAPEDGWAIVNVDKISSDNPAAGDLSSRVRKEVLRGLAFVSGGAYMTRADPLMRDVKTPSDLDKLPSEQFGLEIISHLLESAPYYGLKPWYRTTYLKACQEGWAPTPTNEYQQAIWDKVHAIPKNPMKIEFDPKKGR